MYKYIVIKNILDNNFLDNYDTIQSNIISQEKLVIKKQTYNSLSNEAKLVIETIINMPGEIVYSIAKKKNPTPSAKKIIANLFGYKTIYAHKVNNVFNEIRQFVKEL